MLKWSDRFSCHHCVLGHGLRIDVHWRNDAYRVMVFGVGLKSGYASLVDAKEAAEGIAMKWMKSAISKVKGGRI